MNWKRLFKTITFPPPYIPILTIPTSAICLIIIFIKGLNTHPISIFIYLLSFYSFGVACVYLIVKAPRTFKLTRDKILRSKYVKRFITDVEFETRVNLYWALLINFANVILNVIYGTIYKTNWFFILAFYYATLTIMRLSLAHFTSKYSLGENILGEWKRARACAAVLTLVNLSLAGVVLMMMYQDRGFTYAGILIYLMATYSFYHIIIAVIGFVKYRKYKSPIINSIKSVRLTAALVSMLALETAMLNAFGKDMPIDEKRVLIAATGAGIGLIVIGLSSYMIVESTNQINKIKREG